MAKKSVLSLTEQWKKDLKEQARIASGHSWPSSTYLHDPVSFCRNVLGINPWSRQIEIMEAVRDFDRVSVASGHKIGKSNTAAALAFWFVCSYPNSRVVLTSTTYGQVQNILWLEMRRMYQNAKIPIGGKLNETAHTGLKFPDLREVRGLTVKDKESLAGISNPSQLFIIDEASGVPDWVFETIEGNRAGGAKVVLFSNPTRTSGEFFLSHHKKAQQGLYKAIRVSSEESPNVQAGHVVIPGLAKKEWVDEKKLEWGEDSPIYAVRVKGEFPDADSCTVIPMYLIDEAQQRYEDPENVISTDRLWIGVDVARFGDDETVLAIRRGHVCLEIKAVQGQDSIQIANLVIQKIQEHSRLREPKPIVQIDACGGYGSGVVDQLKRNKLCEVREINVARKATRESEFPLIRDEIWFNLAEWLKTGVIPNDDKLAGELACPIYEFDGKNRRKVESKDEIKKKINRSPDRADALALAVYDQVILAQIERNSKIIEAQQNHVKNTYSPYGHEISPYGGSINPY